MCTYMRTANLCTLVHITRVLAGCTEYVMVLRHDDSMAARSSGCDFRLVGAAGQRQPIEVSILVAARCEHGGASAR